MPNKEADVKKNFEEFFEQHGVKEFVTLYFQRVLLEMYKVGVYSKGNDLESTLIHQYFFTEKGEIRSLKEINTFDEEVEKRCLEIAEELVDSLGDSFFKELPASSEDFDEKVINNLNKMLQKALSKHLGVRWGK